MFWKDFMLSQITKRKFIETYPGNGRKILTPLGYKEIEYIHKTIPYEKYRLKTESGMVNSLYGSCFSV